MRSRLGGSTVLRSSGLQNAVLFEVIPVMPSKDPLARPSTRLFCDFGGAKWESIGGARRSTDSSLGAPLDPWGDLWDHLGLFEPSEGVESSKIGPKLGPKSGSGRASRFFSGGVFQLALLLSGSQIGCKIMLGRASGFFFGGVCSASFFLGWLPPEAPWKGPRGRRRPKTAKPSREARRGRRVLQTVQV